MITIAYGDNLEILSSIPNELCVLAYLDPPFNTGKVQKSHKGKYLDNYKNFTLNKNEGYSFHSDYIEFLEERIKQLKRILTSNGSIFVHVDFREVHYVKVMMDYIFGRDNFMNEIIWAYDYGGRPKTYWPRKHDNILWYVKDRKNYIFNYEEMDRIPYMAPGLVGKEKALRGKTPTDVWWHTIVPTIGKERTGYPTQKPLGILERIVKIHSNIGDRVIDPFAGSGSFGVAAEINGRNSILIDNNIEAIEVMKQRFVSKNLNYTLVTAH